MEFMDTGLPDGGGDSEAEPVLQEQPSGEVDYNNGYEGKFKLEICKNQMLTNYTFYTGPHPSHYSLCLSFLQNKHIYLLRKNSILSIALYVMEYQIIKTRK